MKQIITQDDSITFHNEKYDESYHSASGAIEESFEKFAKPAHLKDGMNILDVCFGLGYNSLAALCLANVSIVGLENDQAILDRIKENSIYLASGEKGDILKKYDMIKKVAQKLYYKNESTEIQIIVGDARKTVKRLEGEFDVVFLDPFSPKKCPELWAKDFFDSIFSKMKQGGVLTTYSCARIVRDNLKAAGFLVSDGPGIGGRSPSTIATKP